MGMNQAGTDKGTRGETGERSPKGVTASDRTGQKSSGGAEKSYPSQTGAKAPGGVKASDGGGERRASMTGGVGMGQADSMTGRDASHMGKNDGRTGELKEGRHSEGHFYKHGKDDYKSKA